MIVHQVQLIQTKLHPKGEGMTNLSKLLSEVELADYLKVSVYKLRRDRVQNRGINYVKYGRTVRYPLEKYRAIPGAKYSYSIFGKIKRLQVGPLVVKKALSIFGKQICDQARLPMLQASNNKSYTITKSKSGQYNYHYDKLTIQDYLDVLSSDYEQTKKGSYLCKCPLKHNHPHEDETKSLVLSEGRDQNVVFYCLSHGGNENNMHFNDGECTQKKLSAKFHYLLKDNGTLDKKCKVYHYGKDETSSKDYVKRCLFRW